MLRSDSWRFAPGSVRGGVGGCEICSEEVLVVKYEMACENEVASIPNKK